MSSSLVVLVAVVAVALVLLVALVVLARRGSRAPAEPIDRAELQARQQAIGRAGRPEHGYGADRTFGGGGIGSGL